MINVVLCASDNYTMPCGVTICSVCENNKDRDIAFYIITDKYFTEEHKKQLSLLISKYQNKKIDFIIVRDEQVEIFIESENSWWTRHVFYRLLSAELLPEHVDLALYLDCDVIVRHHLDDLWKVDLTGKAVGCVPDGMEGVIEFYNRLEYTSDNGYFNSGVLLMNLNYWRENGITKVFSEYIQNNRNKLKHPDQDVLNVVFKDVKLLLPLTYNFQSAFIYKKSLQLFDYTKYREEINKTYADPIILHLSGARPWIKGKIRHPYEKEFFKYRDKTIWRDEPLWPNRKSLKTRIINLLRPLGAKLGLCHIIPDYYDRTLDLN